MARGGTKIQNEKIANKNSLATCRTKRSYGLYSKASQLCLLSGAQIAILATPSSANSNVSFYSYGHSSVDSVVSAFLTGQRPAPAPAESKQSREDLGVCLARKDLGLGLWWDDKRLDRSQNPEEIKEAIGSILSLLSDAKRLRSDHAFVNDDLKNDGGVKKRKSDVFLQHGIDQEVNQILSLESTSAICCIPDYLQNTDTEVNQTLNLQSNLTVPDGCLKTDTEIFALDDDLPANLTEFVKSTQDQDQILPISNSCYNDLPAGNLTDQQEMDLVNNNTEEKDQTLLVSDSFDNDLPAEYLDDEEMMDLLEGLLPDDDLPAGSLNDDQEMDLVNNNTEEKDQTLLV
ncbi:unnamed protein product [Microthlaspi erraticum]|uniref:MADS-box domain-containing protein n=1 Tax=Microthlaspi erraticum TaxID=1685480 RepID=A0A6D2LQE8_9BRAS|nr:unnamed protein product [Microthlaspi erraticum]